MIATDLDGRIESANAEAEQLFGYTSADLAGQPIAMLTPADRVEELASMQDQLRKGERIDHLETVRLHRTGRRIDVIITVVPTVNHAGVTIGATRVFHDISTRIRTTAAQSHLAAIVESSDDA